MNTKNSTSSLDWTGVALIFVSATAFASMAIFARHAYSTGANPLGLMITRFAIAAGLLVALMMVLRRPFPKLDSRAFWVPLGMGAIGYAGQSMGYFTALQHAQAGTVALLLYLYPAIVALLAPIFLRERLTPIKLALLALSFVGMVLTIAPWQSAAGQANTPFGLGLSLMNALIYSTYLIVGGRFLANTDPYANATLVCIGTALSLLVVSVFLPAQFPSSTAGWASGVAIAVIGSVIAIITLFAGLERLGAPVASVVSTVEPVITIALAWLFLQENMGTLQLAGGAVIVIAAALFARQSRAVK